MIRGAVPYRGTNLAPGSLAHTLHLQGKFNDLDQHLAQVDSAYVILHGRKP